MTFLGITRLNMVLLAAALMAFFRCTPTNPDDHAGNSTQTGNPCMVSGTLYGPDGITPAAYARIFIRPRSTLADTTGLTKRLADTATVTTDSLGQFLFDTTLDTGLYVIEANQGDSLLALIDSVHVVDPDTTVEVTDTLKPAGSITGVIYLSEGGDPRKVFVLAFGINRFTMPDSNGVFAFDSLAEAAYDLRIISSLDDYAVLDTHRVPVTSQQVTDLDTIRLPFTGIPTPTGLSATYDTLTGVVSLSWNAVDFGALQGYVVYRNDTSTTIPLNVSGNAAVTDTFFRDTVFANLYDTNSFILQYHILAQDTNAVLGESYSIPVVVSAVSPTKVRTFLTLAAPNTNEDTVSINDTVFCVLDYANATRLCDSILWSVGHPDSVVRRVDLSDSVGIDTLQYWWASEGTKVLYAEVLDAAGSSWGDSLQIQVLVDVPVANAGNDTTVGVGDTIRLLGSGSTDLYGSIASYEWDIGNTGNFVVVANGDTSIVIELSTEVVLRITDDDGNTDIDTLVILVPEFSLASAYPPFGPDSSSTIGRMDHSSVVFLEKMWIIGGTNGGTEKADVWQSADGVTWQSSVDSADFGVRKRHSSVVFDGNMWVIGGYRYAGAGVNLSDVWYSQDGENWTMATDGSAAFRERCDHTSVVFQGRIWVIAGWEYDGTHYNDVWSSTDGFSWVQVTASAQFSPRRSHTSLIFADKMWVIGGSSQGHKQNDIWFSTDGQTWICATDSAGFSSRQDHTSVAYMNKMWVIAGEEQFNSSSTREMNDVWFSDDGVVWMSLPLSSSFPARNDHSSVVFKSKIWVIGGTTGGIWNLE